jgi:hypothetical protein
VSKQRSNRSARIKQRASRKKAPNGDGGQTEASQEKRTQYYDVARSQVLAAWPKILEGLIEKAMCGGYQQTKLLLDLCDLAAMRPSQSDRQPKEQLCDVLLDRLGLLSPE